MTSPAPADVSGVWHETLLRVRYSETDKMGIVYYANYLVWFEIGRTDLCRETGFPYSEIERRGFLLVVTEVGCRFRIPFRYDEEIVIRTTVEQAASRAMRFSYELLNASGEVQHASGFSAHMWLDRDTRRPVRADSAVMKAFEPFLSKG